METPMTRRPSDFQIIFDLPLGSEVSIQPNDGESVEDALARLQRRTARYAKEGRFFRLKIKDSGICILRVEMGQTGPMGDWLSMKCGTRLLLSETPARTDLKVAQQRAEYMRRARYENHERRTGERLRGSWEPYIDKFGRLIVACWIEDNGKNAYGDGGLPDPDDWPLVVPWSRT